MIRIKIKTEKAYGEAQKFITCKFCSEKVGFIFSTPLTCTLCNKQMPNALKFLEKWTDHAFARYTIRWHFSEKEKETW